MKNIGTLYCFELRKILFIRKGNGRNRTAFIGIFKHNCVTVTNRDNADNAI